MADIAWGEPFCSGGGNACLQIGFAADGSARVRETQRPEEMITTSPDALRQLIEAAKAGELDHLIH